MLNKTDDPDALVTVQIHELEGHTETVEFCKFDASGKFCVTAGMNNHLRVWDVAQGFTLKQTVEEIPVEDMLFVEWHPTAPVLMTGGKDYMIWVVNAVKGKIMQQFMGHEGDVVGAQFTKEDGGKQIVSVSTDKTVKLWNPVQGTCIQTIRNGDGKIPYHTDEIQCFDLHPTRPLILTGDCTGGVYGAHYGTGEVVGRVGSHKDSVESVVINQEL